MRREKFNSVCGDITLARKDNFLVRYLLNKPFLDLLFAAKGIPPTCQISTLLKCGYTPLTFEGNSGTEYKVTVANFDGKKFQHWQDNNSTGSSRIVRLSKDTSLTTLTAVYDTGQSLRGFTPLTYVGTPQQPRLTVNAKSLDGTNLDMWMIIDPQQATNASKATYKVYATNGYQNLKFDHWGENGSTDRIRTITISEATAITA